jgi:hypothetical protein
LLPSGGLADNNISSSAELDLLRTIGSSIISIFLLGYLVMFREIFTPDFFHYVTLIQEEYAHMIWIFILWSIHKSFFIFDDNSKATYRAHIYFSYFEMNIGLLIGN